MTINFIDLLHGGYETLLKFSNNQTIDSYTHDVPYMYLSRKNGWYYNKELIEMAMGKKVVVWTDDETMLDYADYLEEEHTFDVNIMTDITGGRFIPVKDFYPNLRKVNSLTKMFYTGALYENLGEETK